jgi:hypothetical protein
LLRSSFASRGLFTYSIFTGRKSYVQNSSIRALIDQIDPLLE